MCDTTVDVTAKVLTIITLSIGTGEQCRPRSDATECGI